MVELNQSFGREHRLRQRRDVDRVFREGQRKEGVLFSFRIRKKENSTPRLLVVVGRKLGKAVVRNRVKRAIREGFRKNKDLFLHLDVVVVPRPEAGKFSANELERKFVAEFQEVSHATRDTADQRGVRADEGGAGAP